MPNLPAPNVCRLALGGEPRRRLPRRPAAPVRLTGDAAANGRTSAAEKFASRELPFFRFVLSSPSPLFLHRLYQGMSSLDSPLRRRHELRPLAESTPPYLARSRSTPAQPASNFDVRPPVRSWASTGTLRPAPTHQPWTQPSTRARAPQAPDAASDDARQGDYSTFVRCLGGTLLPTSAEWEALSREWWDSFDPWEQCEILEWARHVRAMSSGSAGRPRIPDFLLEARYQVRPRLSVAAAQAQS